MTSFRKMAVYLITFFLVTAAHAKPLVVDLSKVYQLPVAAEFAAIRAKIEKAGNLASVSELEPVVQILVEAINSSQIGQLEGKSAAMKYWGEIVQIELFHVGLRFVNHDPKYPYPVSSDGSFPFRATLDVIERAILFFQAAHEIDSEISIQLPAGRSFQGLLETAGSGSPGRESREPYEEIDLTTNGVTIVDQLLKDPVSTYAKLLQRRIKHGEHAQYREFKVTVDELLKFIQTDPEILRMLLEEQGTGQYKGMALMQRHAILELESLSPKYEYRRTLVAIESGLRFLEVVEKIKAPASDDQRLVEESRYWERLKREGKPISNENLIKYRVGKIFSMEHYHTDRYIYHFYRTIEDPEILMVPTTAALSFQKLIKVRALPIGFVGVETKTARVDRHWLSPWNFWAHDVNHVRRMAAYTANYLKEKGITSVEDKLKSYASLTARVDVYLERVKKKKVTEGLTDSEKGVIDSQNQINHFALLILFEILHETALNPDIESILADMHRLGSSTLQPFEHMSFDGNEDNSVEALFAGLHMYNGNLWSGALELRHKQREMIKRGEIANFSQPAFVHFHQYLSLGTLANVLNKVAQGFFDSVFDPQKYVGPVESRTPEMVVNGALALYDIVEVPVSQRLTPAELRALVDDRGGQPELFDVYTSFGEEPKSGIQDDKAKYPFIKTAEDLAK